MKYAVVWTWLVFCMAFLSCTRLVEVSGTSGTGNSFVTGKVYDETGLAANHVVVQILHSDYDPMGGIAVPATSIDTTDSDGVYTFQKIESGSFSIQTVEMYKRTRGLVSGVKVSGDSVTAPRILCAGRDG